MVIKDLEGPVYVIILKLLFGLVSFVGMHINCSKALDIIEKQHCSSLNMYMMTE